MTYTIRRVSLGSALRIGLALGWLLALFPSLALAGLAMIVLRRVNDALGQVTPYELSLLGQTVARFDPLQIFGLTNFVQLVARLTGNGTTTFLLITLALTLAGAVIVVLTLLAFCVCYNVLAGAVGGLTLELRPASVVAEATADPQ